MSTVALIPNPMIDPALLLEYGAVERQLTANETLFQEGDRCFYYHQIVSGSVRWINTDLEGNEFLQTIAEPGESIGEFPLFDGGVYAASAVANGPAVVLRLPEKVFQALLTQRPQIHFAFSALLVKRLRFKFFLMKEVASHQPERIVVALLNFFTKRKSHICGVCNQIMLTRRQIAEMTGLRVETVIRVMKSLDEKQVIRIINRKAYFGASNGCHKSQCPYKVARKSRS